MTFDRLVNMYLIESEQLGPPYIVKNKHSTFYYKDTEHKILHRDEKDPVTGLSLPAYEGSDGSKQWYVDGKYHRLDGPAYEWADGMKEWFVDGKRHRTDGPAIEWADGTKYWYVDGKLHRDEKDPDTGLSLPAVEYADGTKFWFVDGKQHRLDGPAVEYADGSKEWFVDGKELTEEEFDEYRAQLDATDKVSKAGNRLSSELIKGLFD